VGRTANAYSAPTTSARRLTKLHWRTEDASPRSICRTSGYSTLSDWPRAGVVGIHGPYFDPGRIPGYISHGCVRLGVADDRWLGTHLRAGTPVRVV
jgi:hypothetical protein